MNNISYLVKKQVALVHALPFAQTMVCKGYR